MTAHGHVPSARVAHFAAVPTITRQLARSWTLWATLTPAWRVTRGVECRESADGHAGRGHRHAVNQVVDLPVGLGHDHDRLPRRGEIHRGAHHQG
jgi:hypothetical protein